MKHAEQGAPPVQAIVLRVYTCICCSAQRTDEARSILFFSHSVPSPTPPEVYFSFKVLLWVCVVWSLVCVFFLLFTGDDPCCLFSALRRQASGGKSRKRSRAGDGGGAAPDGAKEHAGRNKAKAKGEGKGKGSDKGRRRGCDFDKASYRR